MSDFLSMGGYAGFVWTAYGASAVVLGGLVFWVRARARRAKRRLAAVQDETARERAKAE